MNTTPPVVLVRTFTAVFVFSAVSSSAVVDAEITPVLLMVESVPEKSWIATALRPPVIVVSVVVALAAMVPELVIELTTEPVPIEIAPAAPAPAPDTVAVMLPGTEPPAWFELTIPLVRIALVICMPIAVTCVVAD